MAVRVGEKAVAMAAGVITVLPVPLALIPPAVQALRMRTLVLYLGACNGDFGPEASRMLVEHVMGLARAGRIGAARFWDLPADSDLMRALRAVPPWLCRNGRSASAPHWVVDLPGSLDEFLLRLRQKHRPMYRRRCRELDGGGADGLTYRVFTRPDETGAFAEQADAIAEKTYQRALGASFVDTPGARQGLRAMAAKGRWRGYVLYRAGEPCAFWHGHVLGASYYLMFTGYDPQCRDLNPGVGASLFVKMVEDLIRETPVRLIEIGFGEEEYKQRFGRRTQSQYTWNTLIFAPRAYPVTVNLGRRALLTLDAALRAAVRASGAKAALRRVMVRRLSAAPTGSRERK